ncbi:hypothetical protein Vretifemale_2143 [Volvox reticuliferus]|nr:hypothetical protein Vretifemale_2143 [Volvox reticuliferus]
MGRGIRRSTDAHGHVGGRLCSFVLYIFSNCQRRLGVMSEGPCRALGASSQRCACVMGPRRSLPRDLGPHSSAASSGSSGGVPGTSPRRADHVRGTNSRTAKSSRSVDECVLKGRSTVM